MSAPRVSRGGRRSTGVPLRDPDACPAHGHGPVVVIKRLRYPGYALRRLCCTVCKLRWNTFETRMDPLEAVFKIRG